MSAAPESLRAEVESAIRDRRLATIDDLGADAVLWLSAAPVWSLAMAEAAGFPAPSVTEFVRRACDASWCKVRGGGLGDDAPPDLLFWMPDEVRREVVEVLHARLGSVRAGRGRPERLEVRVDDIAQRVSLALAVIDPPAMEWRWRDTRRPFGSAAEEVPGALWAWTRLFYTVEWDDYRESSPVATRDRAATLVELTEQAVARRALGTAQDLVAAGEAFAAVLAGTAEQALSRARRLLTLGMRRRQDERALGRYLDRPELSDAVARLLNRDAWALHLRGVGGVGKTMLIRYLASGRYAAERKLPPVPVARADFDHLSPDYPVRRPVQLLLELADELALHTAASERADRALSAFRARAARAHEAVSGLREAGVPPLRNEEVARAVDGFGDVLAELGDVLLILDTCEELAKADLGDPAAPAVRATFEIIERLHQRAPSVRVLFAGRRPLPDRPYLAVQPVAGFTVDEARRYLAAFSARPLPADLADEMIRQSPAVDGPAPAAGRLPDRVSPFDLALYAAWADEDPDLGVAQVSRGSDAYIEGRIIERLNDPLVVRALPVLACAGRCGVDTIAAFLDRDPATLGRRLAEQEWIDADGDPPAHVAARPALASKLRRYFEADERCLEFTALSRALASALLTRLHEVQLAEIDVDELIAALRLADPDDAAALWDSIAGRAMEPPGRWSTVLNMTRRILGEWEEEEWPTTPALRATVTAAHIAASRRDSPLFDARGPWETVRAWASQHPDPLSGWRLLVRAALGLLPYTPDDDSLWSTSNWPFDPLPLDARAVALRPLELAAALVESAHRLLEAGQHQAAERLRLESLDRTAPIDRSDPRISAWAEIAMARLFADDAPSAARNALERAEEYAASASGSEPSWPDWIPPDDLLARVRIEHGLIAPPGDLSVLDAWESYAAGHLDTIDGERLASLCLRIRLRHGTVDAAVAERWEAADSYLPDRVPACTAHDLVPPLFVSVAQAWLAAGQPERALGILDGRGSDALATRQDDLTVRHADATMVGVIRRLRLAGRVSLLHRLATSDDDASRDARGQAWRTMALAGHAVPVPSVALSTEDPGSWHARWQSSRLDDVDTWPVFPPPVLDWPPASTSADTAGIQADLAELRRLFPPGRDSTPGALAAWESALTDWLARSAPPPPVRSAEPHAGLRAALRMAVLTGKASPLRLPPGVTSDEVEFDGFTVSVRVPRRLLAEMAFEEAELMALRLPEAAARLFGISAAAYHAAGDALGDLLARLSIVITSPRAGALPGTRPGDARRVADAALSRLRERNPALATTLAGPPEQAGPWRYWAEAVQAMAGSEAANVGPLPAAPAPRYGRRSDPRSGAAARGVRPPDPGALPADRSPTAPVPPSPGGVIALGPRRRRARPVLATLSVYLGLCIVAGGGAFGIYELLSGGGAWHELSRLGYLPLVVVPGALAAVLGRTPKIARLAEGRGIGVARLGTLLLDAELHRASDHAWLEVSTRPWRTAPRRARMVLLLLSPAVLVARTLGRALPGYQGTRVRDDASPELVRVRWSDPRPEADVTWWLGGHGTALGTISSPAAAAGTGVFMPVPWERVLGASLSPAAAGRVEWIRLVDSLPAYTTRSAKSVLQATAAWDRALRAHYSPPRGVGFMGVRHVIGRAVASSAGPVMDVTGEVGTETASAASSPRQLLGVTELKSRRPAIVILQAEPAIGDAIGTEPPDDQAEKLRLGAELAGDGVPAVLLLPVLPESIAADLAVIVTRHVRRRQGADAQVLLTRLREAITPHVPPQVLDDVVLFLNEANYRS